jgi:hypothetical protein
MAASLFFEDLRVGQTYRSPDLRVTAEMWRRFLDTIDLDKDRRRQAGEESWINNCFSSAVTMRLIVASDFSPNEGVLGLKIANLSWPRPICIGDVLNSEITVSGLRKRADKLAHGLAQLDIKTQTAGGDVVQEMTSSILVPYRRT